MAEIGTSVGTLQVADPDIDQLFTFEILGGSNEIFDIDGNILKVKRLIDCIVFNTVFNVISLILWQPVHLSILSWSSFNR